MNQNLTKVSKHIYKYTLKLAHENQLRKSYEQFSQLSAEQTKINLDFKKLGIPHNPSSLLIQKTKGCQHNFMLGDFDNP